MSDEEALLRSVVGRPEDGPAGWLVLADWLDEHGRGDEAALLRLQWQPSWRPDLDAAGRQAAVVALLRAGVRPCVPAWQNGLGMQFVWCPPGAFDMGCPEGTEGRDPAEGPVRRVTLTRGFWLSAYAVTQDHWRAVIGHDLSGHVGPDLPVENVSWEDCGEFCRRLAAEEGQHYRLPTEAEWEYACRAGTPTPFFWGATLATDLANYNGELVYGPGTQGVWRRRPVPVWEFPPNAWGLYQMHGNVWEWCADFLAPYPESPQTDPTGPTAGEERVLRGGAWYVHPNRCRSSFRVGYSSSSRADVFGCRLVVEPGPDGWP